MIQLYTGLSQKFSLQGKKYSEKISGYITEFNSASKVDTARISDAESKMLLTLPAQQPEFISVQWAALGQLQDSGVTLKSLKTTQWIGWSEWMHQHLEFGRTYWWLSTPKLPIVPNQGFLLMSFVGEDLLEDAKLFPFGIPSKYHRRHSRKVKLSSDHLLRP